MDNKTCYVLDKDVQPIAWRQDLVFPKGMAGVLTSGSRAGHYGFTPTDPTKAQHEFVQSWGLEVEMAWVSEIYTFPLSKLVETLEQVQQELGDPQCRVSEEGRIVTTGVTGADYEILNLLDWEDGE